MEGRETRGPPNPALPYREDCWSEGETSALVEAWGDRYLELNRGNLRQKHWQEVADAVNSRRGAGAAGGGGGGGGGGGRRPPRTDVQCKNRIDTLKKKYKVEKARIADSAGALHSPWPFYARLDALIGSSTPPAASAAPKKPSSSSPPFALPLPFHRKGSPLPAAAARPAPSPSTTRTRSPDRRRGRFRRGPSWGSGGGGGSGTMGTGSGSWRGRSRGSRRSTNGWRGRSSRWSSPRGWSSSECRSSSTRRSSSRRSSAPSGQTPGSRSNPSPPFISFLLRGSLDELKCWAV